MCVFITTAVPIIKLFAWGRGIVEDMCYEKFLNDEPSLRPVVRKCFLVNLNSRSKRRRRTHNLGAHNICRCTEQRVDINTM